LAGGMPDYIKMLQQSQHVLAHAVEDEDAAGEAETSRPGVPDHTEPRDAQCRLPSRGQKQDRPGAPGRTLTWAPLAGLWGVCDRERSVHSARGPGAEPLAREPQSDQSVYAVCAVPRARLDPGA